VNPAIVIPTYWSKDADPGQLGGRGTYDYSTPITKPLPELENCLSSLERVRGVLRVIVLVVAETSCAVSARARVDSICRSHPSLNLLVIGDEEAAFVSHALSRITRGLSGETVSLRGYGAIKNMGLAVASIFGHDCVVFLDDDEVALDEDYLARAVYGLDSLTRQNLRILAKTGFYVNFADSPYADIPYRWSEKFWSKSSGFNEFMRQALFSKTRISRSTVLCGGCCAVHAAAFSKVPFDPYISRGEDLDYVLDLRAHGFDVWFDNEWSVRWQPPQEMAPVPTIFMQDVYRWLYEYRKLDVMNARQDLRTITPGSLAPYPSEWITPGVRGRVYRTALRRALSSRSREERTAYVDILHHGWRDADREARVTSSSYLSLVSVWPKVVTTLWNDALLQNRILGTGTPAHRRVETDA